MVKKSEQKQMNAALCDIIVRPVITEKAMKSAENNQAIFLVSLNATKPQIKKAIESVFGVEVKSVNTLRQAGKVKSFRGKQGVRSDVKKAIVTLAKGQAIDVTVGV